MTRLTVVGPPRTKADRDAELRDAMRPVAELFAERLRVLPPDHPDLPRLRLAYAALRRMAGLPPMSTVQ